jgi:hypothetical protein
MATMIVVRYTRYISGPRTTIKEIRAKQEDQSHIADNVSATSPRARAAIDDIYHFAPAGPPTGDNGPAATGPSQKRPSTTPRPRPGDRDNKPAGFVAP